MGTLAALLDEAEVVLSVVPPGEARAVAADVAAHSAKRRLRFADLTAVAPATPKEIAASLVVVGVETVDGSLVRATATPRGHDDARPLRGAGGRGRRAPVRGVERTVVGDALGLASAVKMCTASVYKGRVAILAQALRTAHAHGVVEPVLADLAATGLADRERVGATLARASAKAWRYVAEMEEIARTQESAGLTPDLFEALADVDAGLAALAAGSAPEDVPDAVPLEEVLERLAPSG